LYRQKPTFVDARRRPVVGSNAFSKKAENHAHSVALFAMYYNFVRIHKTLRTTPAMATNATKRRWEIGDIVEVLETLRNATSWRGIMKARHVGFLLCLGALVVQASTAIAPAADFTCQVQGGSFVLDDDDFKAMKDSWPDQGPPTRERFASFKPTTKARICDTRMLARLFKAGKAHPCDYDRYKNFAVAYFADSELDAFNKLLDAANEWTLLKKKCP
jgi:hypothetical protein